MSRKRVKLIYFLIILFIFQCMVVVSYNVANKSKSMIEELVVGNIDENIKISELHKKLDNLKNIEVNGFESVGESWSINLKITGNKYEVIEALSSIKGVYIEHYNILYDKGKIELTIQAIS